jgi:MoaA/NifB/PqqE/SkfB family radical SAM enzyme
MQLLESEKIPGSGTANPGSICNLACVTCNAKASTRWAHELGLPVVAGNPRDIDSGLVTRINQMQGLVIGGGEPVLNFSTKTLLSVLRPEITLTIHFNGTVLPKKDFLNLSSRFVNIRYVFSLDGIEKRFEYLRWPAKWNQVTKNIQTLVHAVPDNVQFGVNITISQLNKNYVTEIVDWVNLKIPENRLGKSTHISYNHAEDNLLSAEYLDALDGTRNTNWRDLFPLAVDNVH